MENNFPVISSRPAKPYMQLKCDLKADLGSLDCSPDPAAWESGRTTWLWHGQQCTGAAERGDFQANRESTDETKIFGEMDIV
jgi:hypothetical protein